MSLTLPIAEFAPDQPAFPGVASDAILNVLPRTKASYGPFPGLTLFSSALGQRCQGAYSLQNAAGNVYVYAGDATKLYELAPGTTSFADKSLGGGYANFAVTALTNGCTSWVDREKVGRQKSVKNKSDPPKI